RHKSVSQPVGGRGPERSRLLNWLLTQGLIPRSRSLGFGDSVGEVCTAGPGPWPPLSLLPSSGSGQLGVGQVAAWQVGQAGKLGLCLGTAAWARTTLFVRPLAPGPGPVATGSFASSHLPARRAISDGPAPPPVAAQGGGEPGRCPQPPDGGAQPPLGERPDGAAGTERRHRAADARPASPLRPPGRGRAGGPRSRPAGPVGRGEGGAAALRHPPHCSRPAGMEGHSLPGAPDATSFADDVLRVFGANHSLSAGQLSALLQRLGAAPALGSALPIAHLHHNQVLAPRGLRDRAGQLRSVSRLAGLVFPHGEAGKEGAGALGSGCGQRYRRAGEDSTGESCRASVSCCG
ncbi:hypothetical protein Nmel_006843, partial [Mimus melanotis]